MGNPLETSVPCSTGLLRVAPWHQFGPLVRRSAEWLGSVCHHRRTYLMGNGRLGSAAPLKARGQDAPYPCLQRVGGGEKVGDSFICESRQWDPGCESNIWATNPGCLTQAWRLWSLPSYFPPYRALETQRMYCSSWCHLVYLRVLFQPTNPHNGAGKWTNTTKQGYYSLSGLQKLMDNILGQINLFLLFPLAVLRGLWDLSFLTRDRSQALAES